jgi:hypothetical protein
MGPTDILLLPTNMIKLSISYKRHGHSTRRMTASATRDLKLRNIIRQIVGDKKRSKQFRLRVKFRNEWMEPGLDTQLGAWERAGAGAGGKMIEMKIEEMDGKWMYY